MLLGRGSINGSEINRLVIDNGGFFTDIAGQAPLTVVGPWTLNQNFNIGGTAVVELWANSNPFGLPFELEGDLPIQVDAGGEAARARTLDGSLSLVVDAELLLSQRHALGIEADIMVDVDGQLRRSFISRWSTVRRMTLKFDGRDVIVRQPSDEMR